MFTNNITLTPIHSDDKELLKKCREIWNQITQLIGINSAPYFIETNLDDDDEFINAYAHKNTSLVESNYRNRLIIVLHSVFNNCL